MGCGSSTAIANDEGARRHGANAEIEGKPSATDVKPTQNTQGHAGINNAGSNTPEIVTPTHDPPQVTPVSSTTGVTTPKPPSPLPPISSKQEIKTHVKQDPNPRGEMPTAEKISIFVSTPPAPPLGQFLEQQVALGIASTCSDRICDLYDLCTGAAADGHGDMSIESFRHLGELYHKDFFNLAQFLVWWDLNVHQHVRITKEEFGMYLADVAWRATAGDIARAESDEGLPLVLDTLMKQLQTSSATPDR